MRLRTLPLSTAGIVLGIMLACAGHSVPWYVILLTILTTVSLQILSNMSNELGDWLSGVDGQGREGPKYGIEGGGLTEDEMRSCIRITVLACCILGLGMIRASFGTILCIESESLVVLGAAAIWAAMHYTLGKKPYGYRGLGDVFVFIFFGLVPRMLTPDRFQHPYSGSSHRPVQRRSPEREQHTRYEIGRRHARDCTTQVG